MANGVKMLLRCVITLCCLAPTLVDAQEPPAVPSSVREADGVIPEPDSLTQLVLFVDRHLGKGDLTNGIYVDYASMIPGAGWGSAGPGWRHWYAKDYLFVDSSAAVSVTGFKTAQARVEVPGFLKSRLALGIQGRWQNYGRMDFFGGGPDSTPDRSIYSIESRQATAYASLRPVRWLAFGGQIGWMDPRSHYVAGDLLKGLADHRTFVPTELSMTIDTRDFPERPSSGILLRGVGARYDDRTSGANTFKRYEAEAAGFLPIGRGRLVLAAHGWFVRSDLEPGKSVPFYLQPGLGGSNTLRSFMDYRFRDDNMLVANAEARIALLTHLELALFADAGNVAKRASSLDLDKRSYGAGLRLHTRRQTFLLFDAAKGNEGWMYLVRLRDPLAPLRLTRRPTLVPFAP